MTVKGPLRLGLASALLLACFAARAAGWVAFAAPELPQTRKLFEEFKGLAAAELARHGLELRYVGVDGTDDARGERQLAEAMAGRPRAVLAASARIATVLSRMTTTTPVIFASVADPVRAGLVKSLARPGGNLTGFTYDIPVEGKQLELLRELAPSARRIGVLEDGHWLHEHVTAERLARHQASLPGTGIEVFRGATAEEMARIVEREPVDAWLVPVSNAAADGRATVVAAMRKARKPAVFGRGFFVDAGGLASYQEVIREPLAIWHDMLKSVLAGVPPGDIPVQRPRHFELAINLAEARRLGLEVPASLLRRADRVVGR